MSFEFHTLDVFTERRFAGNPLAVVLGADDLDSAEMHAIAREFNVSETVFVLKPLNPMHSARIRIFTPAIELPFAGHPTIGTAVLLAELRASGAANDHDAIISLEETIGLVRVGVRLREGHAPFAEFDTPHLPEDVGPPPMTERLAGAVGLMPGEIGFANHRPTQFTAGVPFTFIPVATLEAIAKAEVQVTPWFHAFGTNGTGRAYLYCKETMHNAAAYHARMFSPVSGIPEDPATGSAAAAFAGVIQRFDAPPDGLHKRMIEQGYEMGRPSHISLALEIERGKLQTVRIGGSAVRVSHGRLEA